MNANQMKSRKTAEAILMTGPEGLAKILKLDDEHADLWGAEEMQAIWLHQLSAPIELDLGTVASSRANNSITNDETKPFLSKSFGELLEHPRPPSGLLNIIEEFAKQVARDSEDAQLRQVTTALYYASHAARLARCDKKAETFDPDELKAGFNWSLSRLWLDPKTKQLIREARDSLTNNEKPLCS
jgi:hypothetical protein